MLSTILVPLDGSGFAERALPLAERVARRTGARVWLVRVHVPLPAEAFPGRFDAVDARLHATEESYVQRWARVLSARGVPADGVVLGGDVPFALRTAAGSCVGCLLVMAGHRRPPLARALFGSITDGLVRRAGVPVLVAGADPDPRDPDRFRRVLLPLDGSAAAESVLLPALDVAGPVSFVLLHLRGTAGPAAGPRERAAARDGVDESLDRVRGLLVDRGASVAVRFATGASASACIAGAAREGDLIAMTTRHGTSGRLFLGSTTDEVVRTVPDAPVLLLRSRDRRMGNDGIGPVPVAVQANWKSLWPDRRRRPWIRP